MNNRIFITRHGESIWNVEKRVQGITDMPLTPKGIEMAKNLGMRLKEDNPGIDLIIGSTLNRADETARIISEITGIPREREPRLIEQNFGEYEGHEYAKYPGVFHEVKKQFACDYNGGESMLRLGQRIFNLLDELKERQIRENKTFLLVTHGGVVRMITAYFKSITNEEFSSVSIGNCELREFFFNE
ncbi:MAG: histidine phosphatase family protein [Lachnospiraceae bacterium]|nr:histidine phosphatase family protein [Lachnospiraceae bacterium]